MADTTRGDFPEAICSDCGKKGCCFKHWGPRVPNGKLGSFCWFCWGGRQTFNSGKPLGQKPPGPEGLGSCQLEVITTSGSVYILGEPNEKGLRDISGKEGFIGLCEILLLRKGEPFHFWEVNPENDISRGGWSTSPVIEIV